jgi:DNA polymerase IIIc chi subunit
MAGVASIPLRARCTAALIEDRQRVPELCDWGQQAMSRRKGVSMLRCDTNEHLRPMQEHLWRFRADLFLGHS